MPDKTNPVRNFFSRVWHNILTSLGTTTLSLVLFSVLVQMATTAISLAYQAWHQRKPGQPVTQVILMVTRDWLPPAIIGLSVVGLAWLYLLCRGFVRTIKADESALVSATQSVTRLTLELEEAKGLRSRAYDLENQLAKLTNRFSGRKWDNFVEKINSLTFAEKHVLYHFVMKGCHMQEHEALRVLEGTCLEMPRQILETIHMKTGLIDHGFNGYDANRGIVEFLEHWASTYNNAE